MNITRVKVRRVGEGEDPAAWGRTFSGSGWLAGSRILKQDGRTWVRRATLPGRDGDVVIKCRPVRGVGDRVKAMSRTSRGDRHWRGAVWLMEHGFATAAPVLLARAVVDGVACELLVTEFIDAPSVLEHLAARDLTVREEHEAARALARMLNDLARADRYNRDGKPSNLLLMRDPSAGFRVVIIDTVAIRRGRGVKRLYLSLANLLIESIGTGHRPRLALCARVIGEMAGRGPGWRSSRAKCWHEVMEIIDAHGDPRPRVDPLSGANEKAHAS